MFATVLSFLPCACEPVTLDFKSPDEDSGAAGDSSVDGTDPPPVPPAPRLTVNSSLDLSSYNTISRSCADGGEAVAYDLKTFRDSYITLTVAPAPGCLVPGDEILLIELQGTFDDHARVGQHELLRVKSVVGDRLEFVAPPLDTYGPEEGTSLAADAGRIAVQRVPSFSRLEVEAEGSLSASSWAEGGTGLLALRVLGDSRVDGRITMSGRGYRGGAARPEPLMGGLQGESIAGAGKEDRADNFGGGGGGLGDQVTLGCVQDGNAGGGGGHKEPGADALVLDICDDEGRGLGGAPYASSGKLLLGAGGGSGGMDNVQNDNPPGASGGAGGGVVWLMTQSLSGEGIIESRGETGVGDAFDVECISGGSTTDCYDHSGPGGGGAGGTIRVDSTQILGVSLDVSGGSGGNGSNAAGGDGGDGGDGVIQGL